MQDFPELRFDTLEPARCPVTLGDEKYVLKEALGEAAKKYKNASARSARMSDGKVTHVENLADAEYLLISLCLFTLNGMPVDLKKIMLWPNQVLTALYDRIVEMSPGLVQKETEEVLTKRLKETQAKLDELNRAKALTNGEATDPTSGSLVSIETS